MLAYFNQFNYPLTKEEIVFFLDQKINSADLSGTLKNLKDWRIIFQAGKFYSLQDEPALYERRLKGNMRALPLLEKANKISKFLFKFPFVEGIFISGSLSKNFASEDADIDFFIITKENRLWIARTFMHIFKKLTFLFGKEHLFCMNYYIDKEALQIEEQNEFTATEIFTLVPASGNNTVVEFYRANDWTSIYYPNYPLKKIEPTNKPGDSFIKKIVESLFQNRLGNWLDDYLMKLTSNRWKEKENKNQTNKSGRRIGLRADKHFCKPNPEFFQRKLLNRYFTELNDITKKLEKINEAEKSAFLN